MPKVINLNTEFLFKNSRWNNMKMVSVDLFLNFYSTFFLLFFIDVRIQLSPFSHTHLPPSIPHSFGSVRGSLIHIRRFYFINFLLNLLGWHWSIKLYRFKVYSSVIYHLHIVLCVHPKSGVLPSPFIPTLPSFPLVITRLLSASVRFFFLCLICSTF